MSDCANCEALTKECEVYRAAMSEALVFNVQFCKQRDALKDAFAIFVDEVAQFKRDDLSPTYPPDFPHVLDPIIKCATAALALCEPAACSPESEAKPEAD